ncbi:Uncharacterised protein [Bordetella pertussis]|nr:Uncharacterised protein [Bordetella pertussis]
MAASAARSSSLAPAWLSANSSSRRAAGMGRLALASTSGRGPSSRTSTPSAPSMLVPDIRPMNKRPGTWVRGPCVVLSMRVSGWPRWPSLPAGSAGTRSAA